MYYFRILSLMFLMFGFISCNKITNVFSLEGNCNHVAEIFREIECAQIFEKIPEYSSPYLKSEGIDLKTGLKCVCEDETRWINNYKNLLEKGDTIIKQKGKLEFSIHKTDTIVVVEWFCDGEYFK